MLKTFMTIFCGNKWAIYVTPFNKFQLQRLLLKQTPLINLRKLLYIRVIMKEEK
jgi:hypothetical protein